jgi:hypothetical protein
MQFLTGPYFAKSTLTVTGLTASADNTVPHGLPRTPAAISYRPQASGGWNEKQAPDALNIYITVAGSGPTSFVLDVEY